ncbi:MAG: O-antigen ligase family protein [Bacteroidia bacterium]|nr:O-antigen ligase family protein [Bacteroidia bacterium]
MVAKWLRQVNHNALFLLCAFPILPVHWVSLSAAILGLSGLALLIFSRDWRFNKSFFLLISGIVWVYMIWLVFSNDVTAGLRSVQVKLLLVIVPLVFSFSQLRLFAKQQHLAFAIFSISAALLVVATNLQIAFRGFTHPIGVNGADFTFSYRIALEQYSSLHPTYYCAIVYTAAIISLYALFHKQLKERWQLVLAIGIVILCSFGGVMAASRATFLAYIIVVVCMIVQQFYYHPKRWYILSLVLIAGILLFLTPTVQNRLKEMNTSNMEAPKGNNDNGTNVRSGIMACDMELLKQYWLVGVGTGNVQQALNNCLSQFDTHVYKQFDYNTHNEYLNAWITCGLFGFMIFVGCLLVSFVLALKQRNWPHLYFLLFMGICFMTENYLNRQMGVTLFAVMQTLFFFKTLRQ